MLGSGYEKKFCGAAGKIFLDRIGGFHKTEHMEILLIDIDSTIPNLALHKIAKYHEARGDIIHWNLPILRHAVDKIYASCIFTKNKAEAEEWDDYGADVGGTGYDIHKTLPDEIENFPCRINWGFTTRGCIRKCEFCFVPEKEGMIRAVGDLYDVWDGKSKNVTLMDNNILALPKHFFKVAEQIRKEKVRVDFNQGLDHRLLTPEICRQLKAIRHKEYHFAFDSIKDIDRVGRAIMMLNDAELKRNTWLLLVGFDSTIEDDIARLEYLKERNQNAYVMRYNGRRDSRVLNQLSRWANNHSWFQGTTWPEFCARNNFDPDASFP